jgi:hypothetical protein
MEKLQEFALFGIGNLLVRRLFNAVVLTFGAIYRRMKTEKFSVTFQIGLIKK